MKCPNCGYTWSTHRKDEEPYEYKGYLKPYLPSILTMLREGHSPSAIVTTLNLRNVETGWGIGNPEPMIGYIADRYKLRRKPKGESQKDRNRTIVTRYREGESMAALAREYGISSSRVHQIVANPRNAK